MKKEIIDMMDKNNSDDRDSVIEKIKLKKRKQLQDLRKLLNERKQLISYITHEFFFRTKIQTKHAYGKEKRNTIHSRP